MEIKSVKTKNAEIEYMKCGSGERNLVILPGLDMLRVRDYGAGVEQSYKVFADEFTIYLMDRKNDVTEPYSVYEMAEDTAEALEIMGVKNACFFGASQGGMIAMTIAARHPGLVSYLAVASATSRLSALTSGKTGNWVALAEKENPEVLVREFIEEIYSPEFNSRYGSGIAAMYENIPAEALRRFSLLTDGCSSFDISAELKNIKCPVLALAGKNDRIVPYTDSEFIAEKTKGEVFIYEDGYHGIYDEAPDFKDRLLAFFNK